MTIISYDDREGWFLGILDEIGIGIYARLGMVSLGYTEFLWPYNVESAAPSYVLKKPLMIDLRCDINASWIRIRISDAGGRACIIANELGGIQMQGCKHGIS